MNQKPLRLMDLIICAASDPEDMVWEPFGGLCSAMIACAELNRRGVACEINEEIYKKALVRIKQHFGQYKLAFPLSG